MLIRPEDKFLFGKSEIETQSTRPRRMWKYSIKMDLTETGRDSVNWIVLTL
jgi:hypothetical protein